MSECPEICPETMMPWKKRSVKEDKTFVLFLSGSYSRPLKCHGDKTWNQVLACRWINPLSYSENSISSRVNKLLHEPFRSSSTVTVTLNVWGFLHCPNLRVVGACIPGPWKARSRQWRVGCRLRLSWSGGCLRLGWSPGPSTRPESWGSCRTAPEPAAARSVGQVRSDVTIT